MKFAAISKALLNHYCNLELKTGHLDLLFSTFLVE